MTGLPMVFSVWAIRREFAENRLDQVKLIYDAFCDSMAYSLENIEDVARKASQWEDFPPEYLVEYFKTLRFDFDESKQEGLLEYYRQAYSMGLLEHVPPLNILKL